MTTDKLIVYRKQIDKMDKEIVRLLNKRFKVVKKVFLFKKKYGMKIEDRNREKEILKKIKTGNSKSNKCIKEIYKLIFKIFKKNER